MKNIILSTSFLVVLDINAQNTAGWKNPQVIGTNKLPYHSTTGNGSFMMREYAHTMGNSEEYTIDGNKPYSYDLIMETKKNK